MERKNVLEKRAQRGISVLSVLSVFVYSWRTGHGGHRPTFEAFHLCYFPATKIK